jgi:hypothetical protein
MRIFFRSSCKAIQTEYWSVDAPPNWHRMSEPERLTWLADNIDSAQFRSEEHHGVEERTILDYEGA